MKRYKLKKIKGGMIYSNAIKIVVGLCFGLLLLLVVIFIKKEGSFHEDSLRIAPLEEIAEVENRDSQSLFPEKLDVSSLEKTLDADNLSEKIYVAPLEELPQ